MKPVVTQRGGQPLKHASLFTRTRTSNPIGLAHRSTGAARAEQIRFAGSFNHVMKNGLVNVFQRITEVFLWGFLAQDMVAMWLPRVGTSLRVGRESYDPSQDPLMEDKPFIQQVGAWLKGNYQGLNWVNFYEETKREIATGPGLLAVPALAFMINRNLLNPGVEISFDSLEGFRKGLTEHLSDQAERFTKKDAGAKAAFKASIAEYIQSIFVDPGFKESVRLKEPVHLQSEVKKWSEAYVEHLFNQADKSRLQRWSESFKGSFGKAQPVVVPGKTDDLHAWTERLAKQIEKFNRENRLLQYKEDALIRDAKPLNESSKSWFSFAPKIYNTKIKPLGLDQKELAASIINENKAVMPKQMPIKQVFSELERFGFVADSVWSNFTKQPQTQRINEVAEHTLKRLIGNKWLFGVGITGLTAAYLMRLAFWSQKHNSYEATRMLKQKPHSQEDEANSAKVQSKFSHKPFAPFASDVSLSGLPFGAQALMPPAANLPPVNMVLTGNSNLWGRPATPWYNAGTAAMPPASAMPNNVLLPNPGAQVWPA